MAKKKHVVTNAEAFYIEGHFGKKSAAEIAADIGLSEKDVADYVEKLKEAGVDPKRVTTEGRPFTDGLSSFDLHESEGGLSVSMTKRASEKADDDVAKVKPAINRGRLKGGIHVINPNRTVR